MESAARNAVVLLWRTRSLCSLVVVTGLLAVTSAQTGAPVAKAVGTVKFVGPNSLVLVTDSGSEITVNLADSTRLVRALPGQADLKNATVITLADVHIGDRIFARGQVGAGNSVIASSAIIMAKNDIADRQQQERDQWRRGVGGIVKEVNTAAGTVIIANALDAAGKTILIHVGADTVIQRYASDSVKFDDAKPGTLDQIKPGDQLRARGRRNADGTEFTAQATVSGTFRDIAGTVVSTDAAHNTITVADLLIKKSVVVKVSSDSQLRKLPPQVAQMIATMLKGGAPSSATGSGGGAGPPGTRSENGRGPGNGSASMPGATGLPGSTTRGSGGSPDVQQMLSRMPTITVSDLQKGDAVILVATEGNVASGPTAITLLAGAEPILSAGTGGTRPSTILSPWNFGAAGGAGGDAAGQ